MLSYILNLLIMVPLVGGMAWGALWLWRKVQPGLAARGSEGRLLRLIEAQPLGVQAKLAVVEFGGRHLLIAVTRQGVTCLSEIGSRETEVHDD